jgi:hypothetical protein
MKPDCKHRTPEDYCTYDNHNWCGMIPSNRWDSKPICLHPRGPQPRTCPLCAGTGRENDGDRWMETPCVCQEN